MTGVQFRVIAMTDEWMATWSFAVVRHSFSNKAALVQAIEKAVSACASSINGFCMGFLQPCIRTTID